MDATAKKIELDEYVKIKRDDLEHILDVASMNALRLKPFYPGAFNTWVKLMQKTNTAQFRAGLFNT